MARKYSRDNRGRFASGGTGATARGGRLKTASGGKRATQTMSAKGAGGAGVMKGRPARTVAGESVMRKLSKASPAATAKPTAPKRTQAGRTAGTVAKPKGLKQGAVTARVRAREVATKPRPDTAEANIPMRGARGKRLDASISRAVKEVKALQRARFMKPKEQVRAEAAARKAAKMSAAAAKPKRVRTPESLRLSRAKQVEKRRSINISNPAGNRAEASGRMAANAARTQQRALAFYGSKEGKPKGLKQGAVTAKAATKASAAAGQGTRLPAAQRPGSLTNTLGNTLRNLARADAARIREIESITGQKIRRTPAGAGAGKEAGARVRAVAKGGKVGPTLRAGLRELAQSDARSAREMASIVRDATPKLAGGKGGKSIRGERPALPGGKARAAAAKPTTSNPLSNSPKTNGQIADLTKFRNSQRTQLKEINRKIKEAGPQAGGLRLQKLKIQDRLNQLNSDLVRAGATTAVRGRRTKKS